MSATANPSAASACGVPESDSIRTTMCCAVFGMLVLSVALWFASPVLFALGLTVFGGSFGAAEVAINVEGATVEREMNKTVLPMMHGFYSLGTLAGAAAGTARIAGAAKLGAEFGATLGFVAGPGGASIGAIAGAVLGSMVGAAAGCAVGAALGNAIDANVLDNHRCLACGCGFSSRMG